MPLRSVICICTPPQTSPAKRSKAGLKYDLPESQTGQRKPAKCITSAEGSTHGAPITSNGRVVPRPRERFVPSIRQCRDRAAPFLLSGYSARAAPTAGRLPELHLPPPALHRSDGQVRLAAKELPINQRGEFAKRQAMPHRYRIPPDKGAKARSSIGPSICTPSMGFGRSMTMNGSGTDSIRMPSVEG